MKEVVIADVVKRQQPKEAPEQMRVHYIVILLDHAGRRALPIWIGPWEGQSIALELQESETPRPLTFQFIARLLDAAGAVLEEVRIEALKDNVFYAIAKLRIGDRIQEIDARPSDALALALRTGAPLYAAKDVLERAGFDLPEGVQPSSSRKGADAIVRELEEAQSAGATGARPTPEELERSRQELLATVFGT